MKIKTKLILSFCVIIIAPILLASLAICVFCSVQVREIGSAYGISDASAYSLMNSVQLLNRYTNQEFEEIRNAASESPELLEDTEYLERINEELKKKASYLLVLRDTEILYDGGEGSSWDLDSIPEYGSTDPDSGVGIYIDSDEDVLVKQIDFQFRSGKSGSAFIITATSQIIPEIRKLALETILAVVGILAITVILFIFWVYRSIVTPIKKLQEAAENIKEGNLEFTVDVSGEDELGELGVTFEKMRQRLKDNAEEKINNEKENRALISNIAHDLKTPITAVKGYAEGILDGVANTPEKVDKYVRTIYNKANEMDTLINELTLYSKIDANRIPYNFAKVNVAEYVNDCVQEIGLDLESKGIGLDYYNYVAEDTLIIADPEQLRRVINNIVSNSVKYMDKWNGRIHIRIKDVGDFIQVEIEDNGRGIAQKDLPYIFDRFFRADASRSSATGGSGIGLSIVKKIIEDHGGKIWATSKEETGTIMYFVIRKYQEVPNE